MVGVSIVTEPFDFDSDESETLGGVSWEQALV